MLPVFSLSERLTSGDETLSLSSHPVMRMITGDEPLHVPPDKTGSQLGSRDSRECLKLCTASACMWRHRLLPGVDAHHQQRRQCGRELGQSLQLRNDPLPLIVAPQPLPRTSLHVGRYSFRWSLDYLGYESRAAPSGLRGTSSLWCFGTLSRERDSVNQFSEVRILTHFVSSPSQVHTTMPFALFPNFPHYKLTSIKSSHSLTTRTTTTTTTTITITPLQSPLPL
ncbi:hypothetical protein E2C01_051489 [Portunus trituberculatus]|uniref:Uncharacterized protein n=1 Tax=Portunus trituberculatus TaxID=210409 RepID=A0A5B7GKH0_PORTR|nr:hypothetical protein [Portunus trituberculatus]